MITLISILFSINIICRDEQFISFLFCFIPANNALAAYAAVNKLTFLDKVMSRNFNFKKDDFESHSGAKKHRFNAEYSGELEASSRKKQKSNKRKVREAMPEFDDLH